MNDFILYIWQSFYVTVFTFLLAFGIPLFLAFIQNFISGTSEKLSNDILGGTIYKVFVASIGVPIHETGHAIFALIFGHKITEIKLFKRDTSDGRLGYVNHSYNKKNIYQNIGNFFIGIGPVIFGTLILYILSRILFSYDLSEKFSSDLSIFDQVRLIFKGAFGLLAGVFSSGSFWKSFIFLYLVFAIGNNITLSKADLKGTFGGLWILLLVLFIINFATLWLTDFASEFLLVVGRLASGFSLILGISIVLNLVFLGLLIVLKRLFNK
ncbi:hypothetical protein ACE01N_02400 [Saccharicrinis sp. FJH2]|uniref:hypothetical protein n=1 Tax=unclassified Saccharicrinis TaxID=2646859 RepID=UPI0035D4A497